MTFLLYGANGYTGRLVAREAARRGLRPTLAGRNGAEVAALGAELGLAHIALALDDRAALQGAVTAHGAVLHCAGPFRHTAGPMVDACLAARVPYLDVTGESEVFLAIAARDDEARARGVTLLPGVGFDVVPTDGLALYLKRRLPDAGALVLAFHSRGGRSRGTALTALQGLGTPGLVRKGGRLTPVPPGWKTRIVDFGRGPRSTVTIPWGDVVTAWYTTGIPDIEVYAAARPSTIRALRWSRWLGPVLRRRWVRERLAARIRGGPAGPSDAARAAGGMVIIGEVRAPDGRVARARLDGPDGYTFTAHAALDAVSRVLAGGVAPGFLTPGLAFGPDFALAVPGTIRHDLPGG